MSSIDRCISYILSQNVTSIVLTLGTRQATKIKKNKKIKSFNPTNTGIQVEMCIKTYLIKKSIKWKTFPHFELHCCNLFFDIYVKKYSVIIKVSSDNYLTKIEWMVYIHEYRYYLYYITKRYFAVRLKNIDIFFNLMTNSVQKYARKF